MPPILNYGRKWSTRLLVQLGVIEKDSQSTAGIPLIERVKVSLAAFITLFLVTIISQYLQDSKESAVLLASMGASAVIIFALPSSPLGKPWNFSVSHILGCLVGFAMTYMLTNLALMAALSVASILMLMYIFECIHPPAAATALVPVIASQNGSVNPHILLAVALNLIVFIIASEILKRTIFYRNKPKSNLLYDPIHLHKDKTPLQRMGLQSEDLRRAVNSFDSVLDVNEQDLERIYQQAQQHAYRRRSGEVLSRDIMSKDLITVSKDTTLGNAWKLFRKHKISMLPVINEHKELLGVISSVDFLKDLTVPSYSGLLRHLNSLLISRKHKNQVKTKVQDLMVSNVVVVRDDDHIVALVPLLSDIGLHHIPVLDREQKLCGIITQSDLIAALYSLGQT